MPIIEVVELRDHNDWFNAQPQQIQALRMALGWSQGELGGILGLYVDWKGNCSTVCRWERGLSRPQKYHRARMLQYAEAIAHDYRQALRRLRSGKITARRVPHPKQRNERHLQESGEAE